MSLCRCASEMADEFDGLDKICRKVEMRMWKDAKREGFRRGEPECLRSWRLEGFDANPQEGH